MQLTRRTLGCPTTFLRSENGFQAIAQAKKANTLEISKIELIKASAVRRRTFRSFRLEKISGTDAAVAPPNGKVAAVFQSENLDIKKLFQDVGLKPAASVLLM